MSIKYKSLTYHVFDEENYIDPKIFTKIGSKNLGIFGILELIIGLLFSNLSVLGIGGKYLLILCAPIMTLYNYKKKHKVTLSFFKKKDISLCLKIILNVAGYFIITILGIIILIFSISMINDYVIPILDFLLDNFNVVVEVLEFFL